MNRVELSLHAAGAALAVASGAVTSGIGYAIWYSALRGLKAASAATVQLSVPPLAALGGVVMLGEPLTLDSLPPPQTTRWVVRRKAEVVAAVNGGLLSVDEVCERYSLTVEEFAGWQRAIDRSGMPGLRVTRIQHYKSLYERQHKY